jgi:hypothetical protein
MLNSLGYQMRRTGSIKAISRLLGGLVLGLGLLPLIAPAVRADEMADWMAEMRRQNDEFNRKAAEDREAMDRFNREAQAERDARDKWNREAYEAREAMDKWNKEAQEAREAMDKFNREAQAERDAGDKWNREVQQWRESFQKQQEWDDWLNQLRGSPQSDAAATSSKPTPPKASAAVPAPAPQVHLPAVPQRQPVPLNPGAFRQMALQNQARVRQQIMQARQQVTAAPPQEIQNPFVGSPQTPWRQELPQIIENPFVRSKK